MRPVPLFRCPLVKASRDRWKTICPAWFYASGRRLVIPGGYETDFASIPGWCPNWLIPVGGLSAMPATAHDYMYESGCVSRRVADDTFLSLLKRAGVPFWQRNLMYNYVRALGWVRYKQKR